MKDAEWSGSSSPVVGESAFREHWASFYFFPAHCLEELYFLGWQNAKPYGLSLLDAFYLPKVNGKSHNRIYRINSFKKVV